MKQNGFTLIELMVVVAIIGILSMFAMPQYKDYVAKTRMAEMLGVLDSYKLAAIEQYSESGQCETTTSLAGASPHSYIEHVRVSPPNNTDKITSKVTLGDKQYDTNCVIAATLNEEGAKIFSHGKAKVKILYVNMADTGGSIGWGCAAQTTIGPVHATPNCRIEANIPNTP